MVEVLTSNQILDVVGTGMLIDIKGNFSLTEQAE